MVSAKNRGSTYRFLIVDDEAPLRRLIQRAFQRRGHHCDCAADGQAALKLIATNSYDLVVTDLRMPNLHGHALCMNLLARNSHPRIMAITGVPEPRLARDLRARGVDDVMFKPLTMVDLTIRAEEIAAGGQRDSATGWSTSPGESTAGRPSAQPDHSPDLKFTQLENTVAQHTVAVLLQSESAAAAVTAAIANEQTAVVTCRSPDALYQALKRHSISVLVVAQRLEGFLTGVEVIERMEAQLKHCAAVLVSGEHTVTSPEFERLSVHTILPEDADAGEIGAVVNQLILEESASESRIPHQAIKLVERCPDVPPPPQLLMRLLAYMEMELEEIPIDQLGSDIAQDPHATSELLRLTNSSQLGLHKEVHKAADAVTLLGPKRAIARVFSAAVIAQTRQMYDVPDTIRDWYHRRCILAASTASCFADSMERISSDFAFTLTMLQDIGMMIMHRQAGSRYTALLERVRTRPAANLVRMEAEDYGITHADAGAALMQHWGLSDAFVLPILEHHRPELTQGPSSQSALRRVMAIGEAVADLNDQRHPSRLRHLNSLISYYGASEFEKCRSSMQTAAERCAETSRLFDLPAPSVEDLSAQIARFLAKDAADSADEPKPDVPAPPGAAAEDVT